MLQLVRGMGMASKQAGLAKHSKTKNLHSGQRPEDRRPEKMLFLSWQFGRACLLLHRGRGLANGWRPVSKNQVQLCLLCMCCVFGHRV